MSILTWRIHIDRIPSIHRRHHFHRGRRCGRWVVGGCHCWGRVRSFDRRSVDVYYYSLSVPSFVRNQTIIYKLVISGKRSMQEPMVVVGVVVVVGVCAQLTG